MLQLVFSKTELRAFDLNKIKVEKDTYEEKRADLILSIPFKANAKAHLELLILLEHKSFYDKNLYEQMLEYQVVFRKHSIKQKGCPQPIIAVLFYHGIQPMKWRKSLQEEDFKLFFSKIPVEIRKDMLNYGIRIINTKDSKVRRMFKDRGSKSRGVIKLLDEIWGIREPSSKKVKVIIRDYFGDILRGKAEKEVNEIVFGIVEYLRDTTGLKWKDWQSAERLLVEEGILKKGGIMNIRDIVEEKGRWKGRREGRRERDKEVILNMLKEKADISFISKVTGLPAKEIKKLKNGA